MIALCLGGAPSVWSDLDRAEHLLGDRPCIVVACNFSGIHYPGRLDAWVTHHPDLMRAWRAQRAGNADYAVFIAGPWEDVPDGRVAEVLWDGSSGLYMAQIALMELGAQAVILCGVPMEAEAGHIVHPGPWSQPGPYRDGFREALPEIGGRLRAMGGWTQAVFGAPTPEWIAATSYLNPAARPGAISGDRPMYRVRNDGKTTLAFNGRDQDGVLQTFRVVPGGTSDPVDVNPDAADFVQHAGAVVYPYRPAAARAAKPATPGKKTASKPAATKAQRTAPVQPLASSEDKSAA